jgi:alpha-1,3-glucanase-like protein
MHSSRRLTVLVCALSLGFVLGCVDGNTNATTSGGSSSIGASASGGANSQPSGGSSNPSGGAGTGQGAGSGAAGSSNPSGGSGNPSGGASGSSSAAGGGGTPPVIVFPPATRGATLTYLEYEAEDGQTNGQVLGPSRKMGASNDVAAESSNRKAVKLSATGQYVKVTSKNPANSIVVRLSIPDSGDGQGMSSTLSVYINGTFSKKLSVTSRWSWTYGTVISPSSNNPSDGNPHHFYDDARALIGDIPAGGTVTVQKDADDNAAYYVVDLIDLEYVGPPIAQPAGFVSITADCGATPNDNTDDRAAIQNCINKAKALNRGLYIPQGTFNIFSKGSPTDSAGLNVDNLTIKGAGMWYSTLYGAFADVNCFGSNCKYADFSVFGDTVFRDDNAPDSNFSGPTGAGSSLENIWMEHSKTGYWVGPGGNGLDIKNCRIRNLFADGVNFFGGTSNSIVEGSQFRNTGDDSMASWSPSNKASNSSNIFRFNTVQAPWLANCFGIYGGNDNKVEDNICSDTVQYPGILIAQQFDSTAFGGTTSIQRNSLIRDGGFDYGDGQGALKIFASQGPMSGFLVKNLDISDSTYCGVQIWGGNAITNLTLDTVAITTSGTSGLQFNSNAKGGGSASNVTVSNGGLDDQSKGGFNLTRQAGNTGW